MLHPAPTTSVDPVLTRGLVREIIDATETRPAFLVLGFDNTNYQMRFLASDDTLAAMRAKVGKRVVGVASVGARKISECRTGGRFVDPVFGPPQRVQGRIVAITEDAIVVDAGGPRLHATPTHPEQSPEGFAVGQMITFDAMEGASFTPCA